jgi:ATP-binding cassette subfamily B protein
MKQSALPLRETLKSFLPLKPYFIQNRWAIAVGLICLLVVDFLQLVIPLVLKKAIDMLTAQTATTQLLLRQGVIILSLALTIAVFRYIWRYLLMGHSRRVEQRLRDRLYQHLQTLSLTFYQKTKTGDLMARAINDINAIRMATGMGLVAMTDGLVLGIAAVGFMLSINVTLTLISLIPAPIIVVLTRVLTKRMSSGFERVQKTFSDVTERVREAFAGIRIVKAYNRESWGYQRVKAEGRQYIAMNMNLAKTLAVFFPMMAIFTNAGLAVVIWLGGRLTILGDITTGDFVAFISYLNLLTWPMMAMGWVTNLVQRGAASMRRINGILDEVPDIRDASPSTPIRVIEKKIEIKDLHIKYPGHTDFVLKGIRLQIRAGETIAIVGRVGSGKTTLLRTIPRMLEVPPGTLFIDGVDLRQISLKTLRANIGFVTQEVFVFSDTIRNNIVFGRPGVSESEVREALRAADVLEDIENLENGLDTLLGERGATLSGGQIQRLTIARALIGAPPVLILDDALSMVDTRTGETILSQVFEMRRDMTNLIVSHRASTISRADRVIVLDRGEAVEQGSHDELLAAGELYPKLYRRQLLSQELDIGAG